MPALTCELGLWPILSVATTIHAQNGVPRWLVVGAVSLVTTGAEALGLWLHCIEYFKGWNLIWTFILYLFAYGAVLGYAKLLSPLPTEFQR